MSKYENSSKYNCGCSLNYNIVSGNSLDLEINYCHNEIRADIVVSEYKSVILWGRVINCDNEPIANALVKLVKVEYDCECVYYTGIAHTISDCEGFYQFELYSCDKKNKNDCYKIIVSKAAYDSERRMTMVEENCNECSKEEKCLCNSEREYPSISNHTCDIGSYENFYDKKYSYL